MERNPSTPEKKTRKSSNGLESPLHKQLATPVPSSPTVPRTPDQQTSPAKDRVFATPKSQRVTRVPLTPGSRLFLPVSPAAIRPWQSAKSARPSSTSSLSASAEIPPLPLQTVFINKEDVETMPAEDLRPNLLKALDSIENYERSTKQFRNLANHHLLQSRLQSFETQESAQRHEVERDITKREIERLVIEFVGKNEQTLDLETIRRRLKKARQRLKDLEGLCSDKDREIIELRAQLKATQQHQQHQHLSHPHHQLQHHHMPHNHQMPQLHTMNTSPGKLGRVPHIEIPVNDPASQANFSPLELLATQVLTDRMQHRRRGSSASTISATSDDDMQ